MKSAAWNYPNGTYLLYKPFKPHKQFFFSRVDDLVRYSVEDVKLGKASRAADRIVILARENGIYRLVVRALPDLDGARRENGALALGVHDGARTVGFKSRCVAFGKFLGREAVVFGYDLAVTVAVLEFSVPRISADVITQLHGVKAEAWIYNSERDHEGGEGARKIDRRTPYKARKYARDKP